MNADTQQADRDADAEMDRCELNDVHRRMRNILAVYPATSWTLGESRLVFSALEAIVRGRQPRAHVAGRGRGRGL